MSTLWQRLQDFRTKRRAKDAEESYEERVGTPGDAPELEDINAPVVMGGPLGSGSLVEAEQEAVHELNPDEPEHPVPNENG